MNRLIIIGNGFDLAHGLPTSYGAFLNWIWKNYNSGNPIINILFNVDRSNFTIDTEITCYADFDKYVLKRFSRGAYKIDGPYHKNTTYSVYFSETIHDSPQLVFSFRNKLFELITVKNIENWVDIENIYYTALVSIVKEDNKFSQLGNIENLNSDFNQIRELLNYYLDTEVESKVNYDENFDRCATIATIFEYRHASLDSQPFNDLFLEFPANYRDKLIEFDHLFHPGLASIKKSGFENLFLDFNYTSNVDNYTKIIKKTNKKGFGTINCIKIHGQINDKENAINFGFGDEMDDHYKILENTGENSYLKNIKSFMYFNNSNYRRLLNWIESKDYQIFIMGHSCGLSDRTLLNTLFEHQNCKSIKIFYHEKPDGSDNFTELSQNISRHFNKKSMMREKVVDKSLSKPLPQNVRYGSK